MSWSLRCRRRLCIAVSIILFGVSDTYILLLYKILNYSWFNKRFFHLFCLVFCVFIQGLLVRINYLLIKKVKWIDLRHSILNDFTVRNWIHQKWYLSSLRTLKMCFWISLFNLQVLYNLFHSIYPNAPLTQWQASYNSIQHMQIVSMQRHTLLRL